MFERLWNANHAHERREIVLSSFGWMWVDLLDLPFFIIGGIVALTGFRGYCHSLSFFNLHIVFHSR
jgi:hypothetical protein